MNFSLATSAALLSVLFATACCFPAGLQDACADVRNSSLELNRVAKTVSQEARKGSRDVLDFNSKLHWVEAKDMCDPESVRHKSMPCVGKILRVLNSYRSEVDKVSEFQNCVEFANKVKPAIHKLQEDMSRCVRATAGTHHEKEPEADGSKDMPTEAWEQTLYCRYTMDRLFSFSILTARVFAVGDPAHHTEGSTQMCREMHRASA